jgi:hypothetical protein
MVRLPSLPVILICSGCLSAMVVGLLFRATTFLGATARLDVFRSRHHLPRPRPNR